jgi:hypothetical protein
MLLIDVSTQLHLSCTITILLVLCTKYYHHLTLYLIITILLCTKYHHHLTLNPESSPSYLYFVPSIINFLLRTKYYLHLTLYQVSLTSYFVPRIITILLWTQYHHHLTLYQVSSPSYFVTNIITILLCTKYHLHIYFVSFTVMCLMYHDNIDKSENPRVHLSISLCTKYYRYPMRNEGRGVFTRLHDS